jgi:acyl-CoA dehydrogenase
MTALVHSTGEPELVALVRAMLDDLVDPQGTAFDERLWQGLRDGELHLLALPPGRGGAGGDLADLVSVLVECGRVGAAVPLAENHLAQLVRVEGGLDVHPGTSLIASASPDGGGSGASSVDTLTWAPYADELILLADGVARCVRTWRGVGPVAEDLAGQPARGVEVAEEDAGELALRLDPVMLRSRTDLVRAAQMAGAIRGCYDLSRRYAAERHQFGVRIDSFPAVQQHLVQLAQAASISRVSAFRAAAVAAGPAGPTAARAARLVSDTAARDAVRAAHQLHGAIGMTREYALARLTRRLHWWRLTDQHPGAPDAAAPRDLMDTVWLGELEEAR